MSTYLFVPLAVEYFVFVQKTYLKKLATVNYKRDFPFYFYILTKYKL